MSVADAYLAMLVLIAVMVGSIGLFTAFHRPRRMRASDAAPVDRARRDRIEQIMLHDQAVSMHVVADVWGDPNIIGNCILANDDNRRCFFAVWASVRREMAEALLNEMEKAHE